MTDYIIAFIVCIVQQLLPDALALEAEDLFHNNIIRTQEMRNAEYIDQHGLFIGNHPADIRLILDGLHHALNDLIK